MGINSSSMGLFQAAQSLLDKRAIVDVGVFQGQRIKIVEFPYLLH
jgi:hypothetical protein